MVDPGLQTRSNITSVTHGASISSIMDMVFINGLGRWRLEID